MGFSIINPPAIGDPHGKWAPFPWCIPSHGRMTLRRSRLKSPSHPRMERPHPRPRKSSRTGGRRRRAKLSCKQTHPQDMYLWYLWVYIYIYLHWHIFDVCVWVFIYIYICWIHTYSVPRLTCLPWIHIIYVGDILCVWCGPRFSFYISLCDFVTVNLKEPTTLGRHSQQRRTDSNYPLVIQHSWGKTTIWLGK